MRMINFARRNFKELIRDPLSLVFEIALPIFLLFIFQQIKIPGDTYKLENFTPGIIIFGFSFITLFTSTLVAKDRGSSLLIRLGTSPMKSSDYILGYILSLIPIIIIQDSLFFIVACLLGLNISINIILTIIASIFVSILPLKTKPSIFSKILDRIIIIFLSIVHSSEHSSPLRVLYNKSYSVSIPCLRNSALTTVPCSTLLPAFGD